MEKPLIDVSHLSFRYEQEEENSTLEHLVLKEIDLTIEKGSFVAVLGHNGSGKSTLAKLLNGILLPVGGMVLIKGMDTANDDLLFEIRQTVGMVFQNPDNQIVATIVEEDVAFALENLGVEPNEMRLRVDEALKDVGMYEERGRSPHQLSGGQKQRVAIAGIIAMRPECIVMDEPTAMLDPRGRAEVVRTIKKLNEQYGITIVLITHNMDEAVKADRVIVMDDGDVILDGVPKEVFSHVELLKQVGLDVPQSTELIHLLRKKGISLPEDIISEEECIEAISALFKEEANG